MPPETDFLTVPEVKVKSQIKCQQGSDFGETLLFTMQMVPLGSVLTQPFLDTGHGGREPSGISSYKNIVPIGAGLTFMTSLTLIFS